MAAAALRKAWNRVCYVEAILVEEGKAKVNEEECVDCGTCVEECPEGALSLGE